MKKLVFLTIVLFMLAVSVSCSNSSQGVNTPTQSATPIDTSIFEDALLNNGFIDYFEGTQICDSPCRGFSFFTNYMTARVYTNGAFELMWSLGLGLDPTVQIDLGKKILTAIYPQEIVADVMANVKTDCPSDISAKGDTGNYNWSVTCLGDAMIKVYISPK